MVRLFAALSVMILMLSWADPVASAAEQAGTQSTNPSVWTQTANYLVEHAFELAILLVFLGAILSSYLSRRLRDRCLKHLEGFPVTLECKDGRRYRGLLDAENNGLEILYQNMEEEVDGRARESFLLYQSEYGQLQAMVCFPEMLNKKQQSRRKRAIQRAYTPGLFRRLSRRIRNFYAAIKDALSEAFMLILGRMKTGGPQAELLKSQDKYVTKMGSEVMSSVTSANFDPILERQIGKRVLTEVMDPNKQKQYNEGFLREYSKDFIELQDVLYPDVNVKTLPMGGTEWSSMEIHVRRRGKELKIENKGSWEICVELSPAQVATKEGHTQESLKIHVLPGEEQSTTLEELDQPVTLKTTAHRKADVLLPRHSAIVRHRVRKSQNP